MIGNSVSWGKQLYIDVVLSLSHMEKANGMMAKMQNHSFKLQM